jgi:hypothetical protein
MRVVIKLKEKTILTEKDIKAGRFLKYRGNGRRRRGDIFTIIRVYTEQGEVKFSTEDNARWTIDRMHEFWELPTVYEIAEHFKKIKKRKK